MADLKSVVLVHGAFADGSGWRPVYDRLLAKGFDVHVVQNPTTSIETDVAFTKRVIGMATGPVVLVGHSYGGAIITAAGNDPKVEALAYIAAFAPDEGESVFKLATIPAEGAAPPPFLPPDGGFIILDPAKFADSFAQDVDRTEAEFMAISQVPWATDAANTAITDPAWKSKPSWYLLTTDDRMIPPANQRMMSKRANAQVTEVAASHSVFLSQPDAVVALIEQAARGERA